MREGERPWPIEEIKGVFGAQEVDDVLFGRTVRAAIGQDRNANMVEFCPDIEAVNIRRDHSFRQYVDVEPPIVADGGVLFSSRGDDEHLFVSPALFLDHPLYERPRPAPTAPAAPPAEAPPALSVRPRRGEFSPRREAGPVVLFGQVLTDPEFYQAPSARGGGKELRAKFRYQEYKALTDAVEYDVIAGRKQAESIRSRGISAGEEVQVKGIRHVETEDKKTGKPLPEPVMWVWAHAVTRKKPRER